MGTITKASYEALAAECDEWHKRAIAAEAGLERAKAALSEMIDGVQQWCDAVARDNSWDGWDHHYKFFAYDDPRNGGLTAARAVLAGLTATQSNPEVPK